MREGRMRKGGRGSKTLDKSLSPGHVETRGAESAPMYTPFGIHGIKVSHKKRTHTSPVAQRLLCLVQL